MGKTRPVTDETLFQAGSIRKPIFAMAVGRLAQDGKLNSATALEMLTPGVDETIGIGFTLSGKGKAVRFGHGGVDEGFDALMTFYKEGAWGQASC